MNTKTAADRLCVRRLVRVAVPVLLSVAALAAVLLTVAADGSGQVSGVVVDADGPVAGAVVRQQATRHSTTSAADGSFTLTGLEEGEYD